MMLSCEKPVTFINIYIPINAFKIINSFLSLTNIRQSSDLPYKTSKYLIILDIIGILCI